MSAHPWDEFGDGGGTGAYVSWKDVGQSVKGTITRIGRGTDANDNPCPEIDVDTGEEVVTITAGQVNLKRQLLESRPTVGDTIVILYAGDEKMGRGTMKRFDVAVKPGDGPLEDAPAPAAAAKPSAADLL